MKHWSHGMKRKVEQLTTTVRSHIAHSVKQNTSMFFLDFHCCMNLIKQHKADEWFSPHSNSGDHKNIVPLCINRQMNKAVLQNETITFKSWTNHWQKNELNLTELTCCGRAWTQTFLLVHMDFKCIKHDHHQVLCFSLRHTTSYCHFNFVLEAEACCYTQHWDF